MKKVESYLLTMELTVGLTLHSLVMTNDIKDLDKIITAMRVKSKELAAKLGGVTVPIILQTTLGDAASEVVGYLFIKNAKEFHFTMWAMMTADPANERLMALH
jgi:hypothetical protein